MTPRPDLPRDVLFLVPTLALTAAALAGLFARATPVLAGLFGLVLLGLLAHGVWRAREGADREGGWLGLPSLLGIHLATGLSGGLHSPVLVAYPALLALVALLSRRGTSALGAALLVAGLELAAAWPLESDETSRWALLAAACLATVALVLGGRRRDHRRLDRMSEELERLGRSGGELDDDQLGGASSRAAAKRRVERGEQLGEALQSLLEVARRGLGGRSAALLRRDQEALVVRHVAAGPAGVVAGRGLPAEQGSCAVALREDRPLSLSRASGLVELSSLVKGEAPRAALLVPVGEGGRGLLLAESEVADRFDGDAAELARHLGAWLAEEQERFSELWSTGERAAELEVLSEASRRLASAQELDQAAELLLEQAHQLAPCQRGCVLLGRPGGELQVVAHMGFSGELPQRVDSRCWARWILDHEGPGVLLDSRESPMPLVADGEPGGGRTAALLGAQLRVQDRVVGVLLLEGETEGAFDAHRFRLVTILSNQAASSLETARVLREMRRLAVTDGLTGLANHRHFQQLLASEVARAERAAGVFSLLLLDLDHFKRLNDQYGHPAGDAVLRELARRLNSEARAGDTVARYGGEEFALILPDASADQALATADRIRRRVGSEPMEAGSQGLHVTLSVGVAAFPMHGKSPQTLIERADEALYRAKELGRDRAAMAVGGRG